MLLTLFYLLGAIVVQPWLISDLTLKLCRWFHDPAPQWARRLHRALGPFYVPALATMFVTNFGFGDWRSPDAWIIPGVFMSFWFFRERDDDDDWKRQLQRFAGRVKNLGHRLVVIPEGGRA